MVIIFVACAKECKVTTGVVWVLIEYSVSCSSFTCTTSHGCDRRR